MPVIFKETLLLSSAHRTMTLLPPPALASSWLRWGTRVLLVTQVFPRSWRGPGRHVSEPSFPTLCPWEATFSPGAPVVFSCSPRWVLSAPEAPEGPPPVFFRDSGDLPSRRPSFCGVFTKDRRGLNRHLMIFQVPGTKSRQTAGQAPAFADVQKEPTFDTH